MKYFWTMTLQLEGPHGPVLAQEDGIATMDPRATMQDLYSSARNLLVVRQPDFRGAKVVHFFAAPNELNAP